MTPGAARRPRLLPRLLSLGAAATLLALTSASAFASELDLQLPTLEPGQRQMLLVGLGVCAIGMLFGLTMFNQVKGLPAHQSMLNISNIIYETCKAYLLKQGQLLLVLELFIGACIVYYFGFLQHLDAGRVITILLFSVLGILGSYSVAWFGIRMNTLANSRTAFASLRGKPLAVYEI
ncbi:MAG: sodium-translocating pyrophosphatase, partial [Candidatus Eisenbacteria bacterium]